jgi:hypothetical protein
MIVTITAVIIFMIIAAIYLIGLGYTFKMVNENDNILEKIILFLISPIIIFVTLCILIGKYIADIQLQK